MSMLDVKKLKVSYGGINAVKGIDLRVDAGEMVALIGANGAGKTTTLKAVCGLLHHGGHVHYNGEDVSRRPAYQLVELGIAMVPEGRGVFGRLSVEENLQMGAYVIHDRPLIRNEVNRIYHLFPRLKERRGQTAGTLSGGEQQMLAIGRALMSNPDILMLDEPAETVAARRAVDGPRSLDGRKNLRSCTPDISGWSDDIAGRTERPTGLGCE